MPDPVSSFAKRMLVPAATMLFGKLDGAGLDASANLDGINVHPFAEDLTSRGFVPPR